MESESADEVWMRLALKEAHCALSEDEVPVGCVLLDSSGTVIGRGHNRTNQSCDPTQHAELVALAPLLESGEIAKLRTVHTLVVTIEPCLMCAAALRLLGHRLHRVVFGARNERFGGAGTVAQILMRPDLQTECGQTEMAPLHMTEGILSGEAVAVLKNFYSRENVKFAPEEKRRKKEGKKE